MSLDIVEKFFKFFSHLLNINKSCNITDESVPF